MMAMESQQHPQGPGCRGLRGAQTAWGPVSGAARQLPQTQWLKTTEKGPCPVPEATSLKSRCWRSHAPPAAQERTPPCLLMLLGAPGALGWWLCHSNLCLSSRGLLLPAFPFSVSSKDTDRRTWGRPGNVFPSPDPVRRWDHARRPVKPFIVLPPRGTLPSQVCFPRCPDKPEIRCSFRRAHVLPCLKDPRTNIFFFWKMPF